MSETAAQPDTEPVPPVDALDEPVGPSKADQHESVMNAINSARIEMLREDGVDIVPAEESPDPAEDGETPPPEPEDAGASRDLLPDEPLYTVTVDGQERQVPLSEITTSYQIQAATQNRLDQASRIMRQVQESQQGVQGRTAATAPMQSSDGLDGIDFAGVAEKLQYGEGDVAGDALKGLVLQLRDRGRSSGAAAATQDQVEVRVLEKLEWVTALNRFGEDYQDILQDPHVGGIAGSIARTLYQQAIQNTQMTGRPRRPYWDIFREAGEKTREWRNGLAGQQAGDSGEPTPPVNLSSERRRRKAAAPQPPVPRSGVARSGARRDKTPKSDEQRAREGIHDIQRGRGQR